MPEPKQPKPEKIVILSVRNRKKSINIQWSQGSDTHDDDFHDNPRPSFYKALEDCAEAACSLCEFPKADASKIIVTGITCREDGDNTLALLVGRKSLKRGNKNLNFASSILAMEPDSENKTASHMTEAEAAAIDKVVKEAKKYLGGDRAQGQIDFKDGEPEPEKGKKTEDGKSGNELPFEAPATGTTGAKA